MTKKKAGILLVVVGVLLLVGIAAMTFLQNMDPRKAGLTKVPGYNHVDEGHVTCLAISPECGVCPGEVIDKECYVDKSKFTPQQLESMGL